MEFDTFQGTNGGWHLTYAVAGVERVWRFQFATENAALLFAAMNAKLFV